MRYLYTADLALLCRYKGGGDGMENRGDNDAQSGAGRARTVWYVEDGGGWILMLKYASVPRASRLGKPRRWLLVRETAAEPDGQGNTTHASWQAACRPADGAKRDSAIHAVTSKACSEGTVRAR